MDPRSRSSTRGSSRIIHCPPFQLLDTHHSHPNFVIVVVPRGDLDDDCICN